MTIKRKTKIKSEAFRQLTGNCYAAIEDHLHQHHWRRFVKNIWWANQNIGGKGW